VGLIKKKYSGSVAERFGPTLAAEHLAEEDGIGVDHETLRHWMLAERLWSRQRRGKKHCQRRAQIALWRTGAAGREFPRLAGRAWSAGLPDEHGGRCHERDASSSGEARAEWIAELLCHGLLRSSFVPPKPIRDLRDSMRYRRKLVESRAAECNRLLKLLETANIKLASVATDVFGVSGLLILRALVDGKATPQEMAQLAKKKLRSKIPELELALEGKIEEHHRFLLKLQLDRLQAVEKDLTRLEQRIQDKLQPYAAQQVLLREIPGVDATLAAVIIAELGVDMSVFKSVSQLASWAGVCPGNNESAGKRKSSHIPKGNVYLKTALVEAANSAARAKGTYLRDKFYRLKARRGYKRAAVAIAHKILVSIYHMFSQQVSYNDLGDLYLDKLNKSHLTRNLIHRLERLGYSVTLTLQENWA